MDYLPFSPYIRVALDYTIPRYWPFRERVIFDYELLYVKQGEVVITVEGVDHHCVPGDLFLLKPRKTHMMTPFGSVLFRHLHIHFDLYEQSDSQQISVCFRPLKELSHDEMLRFRKDVLSEPPFLMPDHIRIPHHEIAERILANIITEYDTKPPFYEQSCKGLLIQLLIFIMRDLRESKRATYSPAHQTLNESIRYLQAHLQEKVSISDLARSSGYSKSYFIVLFKQTFGTSPAKYHQMLRIEKSKQLLTFSALAISSIAEMCGYDSVFAFSNVFKENVGISPTQYRMHAHLTI
jgi:AraC-like DNA-binding protein